MLGMTIVSPEMRAKLIELRRRAEKRPSPTARTAVVASRR